MAQARDWFEYWEVTNAGGTIDPPSYVRGITPGGAMFADTGATPPFLPTETRPGTPTTTQEDDVAIDWGQAAWDTALELISLGFKDTTTYNAPAPVQTSVGPGVVIPAGQSSPGPGGHGAGVHHPVPAAGGPGGHGGTYMQHGVPHHSTNYYWDPHRGRWVKKRRRRRRMLTQGDFDDLFRIAQLPNKENVKVALARRIRS